MSDVTYKFDPPLCIPPMSQASIAPIARGRALRVVVADAIGTRIAEGVYRRDPTRGGVYVLVEGTAATASGEVVRAGGGG